MSVKSAVVRFNAVSLSSSTERVRATASKAGISIENEYPILPSSKVECSKS